MTDNIQAAAFLAGMQAGRENMFNCSVDQLADAFSAGFQVAQDQFSPYAQHPRFADYKARSVRNDQQERRRMHLENQRNRRFDFMNHVRNLTQNTWTSGGRGRGRGNRQRKHSNNYEEEDMETQSGHRGQRPGRFFKNQLMCSEWMVERPDDFPMEWIMVPCPKGKRALVVASNGRTVAYAKNGMQMNEFVSLLPGGSNAFMRNSCTILDCIYNEAARTYFVLDIMNWKEHTFYECETEFRFYWAKDKLSEVPHIAKVSKGNSYIFEVLPNFACEKENIENALASIVGDVKLDGLLFYHKRTHYTFGSTPLVVWLMPYMLPEILGVSIPEQMEKAKPANYQDYATHLTTVQHDAYGNKPRRSPRNHKSSASKMDTQQPAEAEETKCKKSLDMDTVVEDTPQPSKADGQKSAESADMDTAVEPAAENAPVETSTSGETSTGAEEVKTDKQETKASSKMAAKLDNSMDEEAETCGMDVQSTETTDSKSPSGTKKKKRGRKGKKSQQMDEN